MIARTTQKQQFNKWAMCGYKGGKCVTCGKIVTEDELDRFHFDHKIPLIGMDRIAKDACRWINVRGWAPFTEKWFAWAETVWLKCHHCHMGENFCLKKTDMQLVIDFAAQARLDEHESGISPTVQPELWPDNPTMT